MGQYVDIDALEDVLREHMADPSEILERLDAVGARTVADTLSVGELHRLIDEKPEVFATQIWQKDDIEALLEARSISLSDDGISAVMAKAKGTLEDCSDNWQRLGETISDLMRGGLE